MTETLPRYVDIPLGLIDPPAIASRFSLDDPGIVQLSTSIKTVGLLQPVIVTPAGERYRLVAGQRRLAATRLLGLATIQAHVVELDPATESLATVSENLHRLQLGPLEEAVMLQTFLEQHQLSQQELADHLRVDRSWVSRRIALLRLPEDLMDPVATQELSPSIALELVRIEDEHDRKYYTAMVLNSGATLNTVRDWVRGYLEFHAPSPPTATLEQPPAPEAPPTHTPGPQCLVCGAKPPATPLRMVYMCWPCARALQDQAQEKQP